MPSSRGSSCPTDGTQQVSCIAVDSLPSNPPGKPFRYYIGLQKWLPMSPNVILFHFTWKESWRNQYVVKCVLTILNWFIILETSVAVEGLILQSWQMRLCFSVFPIASRLPWALRRAAASPGKPGKQSRAWTICPLFFICIFSWRIIALQCCKALYGSCPTSPWISHKLHTSPRLWTSLPPPPHLTPPRCPRAAGWAPCVMQQLPTGSALHVVMQMSQCLSLHSPHPLLPPLGQVCSLCQCLYSCPANSFSSTIFLHPIYMH